MIELRERNNIKHIISDDELIAFAWAAYYANYSDILVNGRNYHVIHITDLSIEFDDGSYLPVGCYAIFKNDTEVRFFNDYELREIRRHNPLEKHCYCFNDKMFLNI